MGPDLTPKKRLALPALLSVAGIALLIFGAIRVPADFLDLPANDAANKLRSGRFLPPALVTRVLEIRTESVRRHPTAERWFTVGHAQLASGNAEESYRAFTQGLLLAPARGVAWAAYANALKAAGEVDRAAEARSHSVKRAPHDPRAVRLRRD